MSGTEALPRAPNWEPLADRDPVPGDWENVAEAAARYAEMADLIKTVSDTLQGVDGESSTWVGKAATEFREQATDLGERIIQARGRYDEAAEALEDYASALKDAQEDSHDLLKQAKAQQRILQEYGPLVEASEDEDSENHDQHDSYAETCSTAESCIAQLQGELEEVVDAKDRAAATAAERINDFIKNDGLKNKRSWRDVLGAIGSVAGMIAGWAGMASLFLGWVPVLGQVLAAVALVGTVISLVGNIVNGNWADAGYDLLGIATAGIGRAAGTFAKRTSTMRKPDRFKELSRKQGKNDKTNRAERQANARELLGGNQKELKQAKRAAEERPGVTALSKDFGAGIRDTALDGLRSLKDIGPGYGTNFAFPGGSGATGLLAKGQSLTGNTGAAADIAALGTHASVAANLGDLGSTVVGGVTAAHSASGGTLLPTGG